jgi:hypothetical protein
VIAATSFALCSFNLDGTPNTPCHLWLSSGPVLKAEKAEKRAIALRNLPLWMALMNVQRGCFGVNKFFVKLRARNQIVLE